MTDRKFAATNFLIAYRIRITLYWKFTQFIRLKHVPFCTTGRPIRLLTFCTRQHDSRPI